MGLPQINPLPKHDIMIPSTQQKIQFRPFLVKEQKILLMALETQDQTQILNAITDIIQDCILAPINIKTLTTFDVEYLFIQIRSKSVGERAVIQIQSVISFDQELVSRGICQPPVLVHHQTSKIYHPFEDCPYIL